MTAYESDDEKVIRMDLNLSAKTALRVVFAVLIIGSVFIIGSAYATSVLGNTPTEMAEQRDDQGNHRPIVDAGNGTTVIATDSNSWLGSKSENPRSKAELVAFSPNGSVSYYNDSHTRYWDIDPVSGTEATVEYAYADHLNASECPNFLSREYYNQTAYANSVNRGVWMEYARAQEKVGACTHNGVDRVNLTTGESTTIYDTYTPGKHSTRWHDADRINTTHIAVADIYLDRVFIVNTQTDRIAWSWSPARDDPERFSPARTGGSYPTDWTHVNDVEVLPDGRLMASVRNTDRVVFLDPTQPPGGALQEDWTLGAEDNYSVLYEQHNPDYIPSERGGPAVLVADSENNRVVEYQRIDGEWQRTWTWTDSRAQWIRDADRLPNGHTLISDSNGDRVFEVNEQGEIIWSTDTAFPYEAERLETGDESTGGPSAQAAGLTSNRRGALENIWIGVKDVLAGTTFSAVQYVSPYWMGFTELGALVVLVLSVVCWTLMEVGQVLSQRLPIPRSQE